MKSPLVLGAAIGSMALMGVTAVGVTYLALHPLRPAPQPVAQAAPPPPALVAPPAVEESPPSRPMQPKPIRVHSHCPRMCPIPAVYHAHHARPPRPMHVAYAQPAYVQPAYTPRPLYAPAPPLLGWYGRPYWRAGWRGPRLARARLAVSAVGLWPPPGLRPRLA